MVSYSFSCEHKLSFDTIVQKLHNKFSDTICCKIIEESQKNDIICIKREITEAIPKNIPDKIINSLSCDTCIFLYEIYINDTKKEVFTKTTNISFNDKIKFVEDAHYYFLDDSTIKFDLIINLKINVFPVIDTFSKKFAMKKYKKYYECGEYLQWIQN